MRQLNLRNYDWTEKQAARDHEIVEITLPYQVKDSILNIMFLPGLQLRGAELVKQNALALKIEAATDEITLTEDEYLRIRAAAENYPAQSRADVQLIDRILNQTPET